MGVKRLGRYELLHLIGSGGSGEVWEATLHGPHGFRRRVAVKLLGQAGSGHDREALVREARLGALVSHPNVVSTLELGQDQGMWFLVMDLVRGSTAKELARPHGLPPSALLDLGRQAAAGLHHIHTLADDEGTPLQLVHRDIKPGNLLVDEHGRVRIVDLGIARLTGTPGKPAGTPGYMAPEQLDGEETARADVFALGATLAGLALKRSVLGRGRKGITALRDVDAIVLEPAFLQELDAVVPGLGTVVVRCMRHDPSQRYASAVQVGDALGQLFGAVSDVVSLAGLVGAPAPSTPTPRTPHATPGERPLLGRGRERKALVKQLDDPTVRLVSVRGPAGCGKTALLQDALRGRPDARWANLRDVATPGGVLQSLCEAVAVTPGRTPLDDVVRALDGDFILALDGIDDALEPLERAMPELLGRCEGLTVVSTSRVRPPWAAKAVELQLGGLPKGAAVKLFQRDAGTGTAKQAEALVAAVDRLPLAIELLAAKARRVGLDAVQAAVRASGPQLDPITRSLKTTWAGLSRPARQALVDLSAFVGSFDGAGAAAVVQPGTDAMAVVAELSDHSLLAARRDRYRMLRTVRAWAEQTDPVRRRSAEVRHGRWLAGFGLRQRDGRNPLEPLEVQPWLGDLVSAHRRAMERDDHAIAGLTALAASIGLWHTGARELAEEILLASLPVAGNLRRHIVAELAGKYLADRQLDRAAELVRAFLDDAQGIDALHAQRLWGRVLGAQGAHDEAMDLLREATAGLRQLGDPSFVTAMYYQAELEGRRGRYDAARMLYQTAMDTAEQVHPQRVHQIRYQLVVTLLLLERYDDARPELEASLAHFESVGRRRGAASSRANLAELSRLLGHHSAADDLADQAIREGVELGLLSVEAHGLMTRATGLLRRKRLAPDHPDLRRALEIATTLDDDNLLCHAELLSALAHASRGEGSEARKAANRAWACAKRVPPLLRARLVWFAARHQPLKTAEARLARGRLPGTPYCRAYQAMARAAVFLRRKNPRRARGALREAERAVRELGVTEKATVVRDLAALSKRAR